MTKRETRLEREFQRMRALVGPHSLFHFRCADLSAHEATEFLKTEMSSEVIVQALPGYMTPDQYREQYSSAPAKYLILYSCSGLVKPEQGEISESNFHAMSIVFGYDFPTRPPILIWYTPIWHPNFKTPHVCTQGRPFAAGIPLDRIVLTVGEMVQYRNYNLQSPLNYAAKEWAERNLTRFPVDDRDLVDSRYRYKTQDTALSQKTEPLVELVGSGIGLPDQLVEFIDERGQE